MDLKIAMVTPWGKVRCGIRTYSEHLIDPLVKRGVEVYVVRWPRFGALTHELVANIVDRIPVDRVDLIHVQHEYGLFKNLEGGFYGGLNALKKPVVTTMHSVGKWEVDKVVAQVSSKVIVHNEFCYRKFGYPEKTVIIPHGCLGPYNCPPRDECKRALGIDPRIPVVGYCGFITNYKGLEYLIEAMIRVPEAALLIAGGYHVEPGTRYIANLKRWTSQALKGRCQWLGYVPDEKLPIVYGSMDLVAYPSRYATESGALLMALSHCKAVIASKIPPFEEKEKKKALVTFSDVDDLVLKIKAFLGNKGWRQLLEEGARKYAEENSWSKVVEKHLELYESLV